jgi:hypothetical protein
MIAATRRETSAKSRENPAARSCEKSAIEEREAGVRGP